MLGVVSFVIVFLVDGAVKPNYDVLRDLVSEAAIGRDGWVQIASFILTGLSLALSALALRQTVGVPTASAVMLIGIGLICAGFFVSDPVPHEHATWHGVAHNVFSVIVFVSLSVGCFVAARWRPTPSWRRYCRATGIAVPVLFVIAGGMENTAGLWQRLTIVVGWSWLAVLNYRALTSPIPVSASTHSSTH
jgi:hypothetical membrane protein